MISPGYGSPLVRQIGAELVLSARTVKWHLRKVLAKFAISSRRELHEADHGGLALPA